MTLLARKVLKISRSAFFGTPGIVNFVNYSTKDGWGGRGAQWNHTT